MIINPECEFWHALATAAQKRVPPRRDKDVRAVVGGRNRNAVRVGREPDKPQQFIAIYGSSDTFPAIAGNEPSDIDD
jgi:hypothetical protein